MRESLGGSMLLYIVVFFVGIVILFFASILSYVKAYRVKNRIINIVDSSPCMENDTDLFININQSINQSLLDAGYTITAATPECNFINEKCNEDDGNFNVRIPYFGGDFNYCICKIDNSSDSSTGYHFEVITFTEFKFPVIEHVVKSNIHGETKTMCRTYEDYYE